MRQEKINKARVILNHPRFKIKTQQERIAIEKMFVEGGLSVADLQTLKEEQGQNDVGLSQDTGPQIHFNILDKAVLVQLLTNMTPSDVLSTCRVDRRYADICRDSQVFHRLLSAHYPESFPTDNPKKQYIALTKDIYTPYLLKMYSYDPAGQRTYDGTAVQLGPPYKTLQPEMFTHSDKPLDMALDDRMFLVKGSPISLRTRLWALIAGQHAGLILKKTKKEVIDYFIEREYENIVSLVLDGFYDYLSENPQLQQYQVLPKQALIGTIAFAEYVRDSDLSVETLSKEAIYDHINANEMFEMPVTGERFHFKPVTF